MLLREPQRLGPSPNIPAGPAYPMAIDFNSGVSLFHPDFRTPFSRSFSFGLQRTLAPQMAIEVRYVGTRLVDGTANEDWNEVNWTTNGFLDEFKRAQPNLQSPTSPPAAARPDSSPARSRTGIGHEPAADLPGRTSTDGRRPRPATRRSTPAPTGPTTRGWPSSPRAIPNPGGAANTLFTHRRRSAPTWRPPASRATSSSSIPRSAARRCGPTATSPSTTRCRSTCAARCRGGLAIDANYVFAKRYGSRLDTLREDRELVRSTDGRAARAQDHGASTTCRSARAADTAPTLDRWLDAVVGGWSLNLTGRVQSGTVLSFGNVRVEGMTMDELRDAFKIRIDPETQIVYTLPQDIIDNTIKAFSTSATSPTGYGALGPPTGRYLAPANGPDCIQQVRGDCAPADVFVEGPIFTRFDLNARKRFGLTATKSFDLAVDFMNLFNAINFNAVAQAGSGATINQVNAGVSGSERHVRSRAAG